MPQMQDENPFRSRDFQLATWQQEAVDAWINGDSRGPYRGTLEIFTGGGKTLIALACAEKAAELAPDLRLAVVVPTEALARQWTHALVKNTMLTKDGIGLLGAGSSESFEGKKALVAVINSAAEQLPALMAPLSNAMLVIDECHRAGAPTFSRVLRSRADYRLGLSATPERDEFDESGEPVTFDEQLVGRMLGEVVFRFDLRQAREAGWLPEYSIHHHGVQLDPGERREYDDLSRRIDDAADRLRALGIETARARQIARGKDPASDIARIYVSLTARRKDLLYRAQERHRVAAELVKVARDWGPRRILLFHERVEGAVALYKELAKLVGKERAELEHSDLSDTARKTALARFRTGDASVLVSVRSLIEGIDVPEADVGISVASSSSVRQRVQSLGRVLRHLPDEARKHAEMHIVYVCETVDEVIYGKENWGDLTGDAQNHYWLWGRGEGKPVEQSGPPREPLPTEGEEWLRLGPDVKEPQPWLGAWPELEYSVNTQGTVTNAQGGVISNPQDVSAMVERLRGRPGGRFWVTPKHRYVLSQGDGDGLFAVGRLAEPFRIRQETTDLEIRTERLSPGDEYRGPADDAQGVYQIRQSRGGVVERKASARSKEFASMEGGTRPDLEANARRVIEAWRQLGLPGIPFQVNALGHAWYRVEGTPRFLADVSGGFLWPTKEE